MSQEIVWKAINNFTDYKIVMNPLYERALHLDVLDRALMEVARYLETGEGIQKLIVEMPPRMGKTLTISELFPGWLMGRRPDTRVILGSYGAALSEMASRRARDYVNSDLYRTIFPTVKPNEALQRAGEWDIVSDDGLTGGMVAIGMDGSVIGKGMHLLILDDMHKNRVEAENPKIRQDIWNAYTNDFLSRFNSSHRAAQIITAQRYHVDDLIGRILSSPDAHTWKRLKLPARAKRNDLLGRKVGQALWRARMTEEALAEIEQRDPYSFASQHQQEPVPRGETMFDATQIDIIRIIPPLIAVVRFWDLAITTNKRSDYTVGLKLGITANEDLIILDVYRDKVKAPEMLDVIAGVAMNDGFGVPIVIEAEKAGIIQFDYILNDSRFRGYLIDKQAPEGSKTERAVAPATRTRHGKMKMIEAHWNADFLNEIAMFPYASHDDQVDALSGAYKRLTDSNIVNFTVNSIGLDRQAV